MSKGTTEGMFNFEPEPVIFDPETPLITILSLPTLFGSDLDETKIDPTTSYPKPTKPTPNIGKILRKFGSKSRSRMHEAMMIIRSSANPIESDFA